MDSRLIENINPHKKYRIDEAKAEEILNCSRSMVYKLMYLGELDYVELGTHRRIPGWSLIDYLQRNDNGGPSDL